MAGEYEASGLSRTEFCRKHGLSLATLARYRKRSVPVIQIENADHRHNRSLYLRHLHDGRDLHLEYAEKVLAHQIEIPNNPTEKKDFDPARYGLE